ncbi:MAG: M28 family peptidase [Saprospiraceae bacterium]|nr:M28 family peptidase [Saprospiraceae bacterium]
MKRIFFISTFILSIVMIVVACKKDKKEDQSSSGQQKKQYNIPAFNGDSAFVFVKKQVDFGPRVPGTEAHKKAQQWFVEKFRSYGAEVEVQKFDANFVLGFSAKSSNIIAKFNPGKSKKILIAAHYDSRKIAEKDPDPNKKNLPIDGADDGASGVGVIFELARILKNNPLDLSIDFVLFDAEDNGNETNDESWCLGSQYWSKNAKSDGYKADFGVLLDLVGAKGAVFTKEYVSKMYAADLQATIWNLAANMGYGDLFADIERGSVNDDHLYVNRDAGIPMVNIINMPDPSGGFGPYHHTHDDNINIIDVNTLRRTGQVVTALMYKYANDDL